MAKRVRIRVLRVYSFKAVVPVPIVGYYDKKRAISVWDFDVSAI
ncbi:MAG: hypothetical protein OEQ74_04585 [Gammaproteobacteria bacterium]|nr:hypothetical protein [Gammaproteobacteria bacterium]